MHSHEGLKLKSSIINCCIRPMQGQDISNITHVHAEAFPRQLLSELWISCNYKAFPRIRYFATEIIGYIQWTEKVAFVRKRPIDCHSNSLINIEVALKVVLPK